MGIVRWKRGEFRIVRHPVDPTVFAAWIDGEGKRALRETLRNTSQGWFLGKQRARRRLYRSARGVFRPNGTFSATMKKRLDRLPLVIRSTASGIHRAGYRALCTYDATTALTVVPRGVLRAELRGYLTRELSSLPQVRDFAGLTEAVVARAALDAESRFFDHLARGRQLVDETGRGIILDVDRDFRWRLDGVNGHYYYACSLDESTDLKIGKERRRFVLAMKESFHAQAVYLKRMRPEEIADMADAFRIRRSAVHKSSPPGMILRSRPVDPAEPARLTTV